MSKNIKIRKGADIKLAGAAERVKTESAAAASYAIKPTDFYGLTPKLVVKEGDSVKAGSPIFQDKYNEYLKFTSPVSGKVTEIVRGAKRKILEIRITPDGTNAAEQFDVSNLNSEVKLKEVLMASGLWAFIKQRPYDVIANPQESPKSIFISAFDSAPLGPDYDFVLHGQLSAFQTGIDALAKLTKGKVHLNMRSGASADATFKDSKNVEKNMFAGPHPAGNVGVQIHHIDPINKGQRVWTVNVQAVAMIGRFLQTGIVDMTKTVALAGSEVEKPKYYTTKVGAQISSITASNVRQGDNRIISGNVLTGNQVSESGYLGFYDDLITVIPEGREPQFMGWLAPNFNKFSLSRAYFSWLLPNKSYRLNTNMNGEDRAFVMSGQYENVLPMDIYPVHLIKAIMTKDIEKMEALGIYEVAPEDLALCEYACTSKIGVQNWIREGIDVALQELG